MSFVGYRQVSSDDDLEQLIEYYTKQSSSYYFLRWAHRVSGMVASLPDGFPSPEGQVFNADIELRWKRQKEGYSLLLLSESLNQVDGFTAIPGYWEAVDDRSAHCHKSKETQYPRGFHFGNGVKPEHIQQRYFRDRRTATIHFVALTVSN